MTQKFDPTTHDFGSGQQLVTFEDFHELHPGSVILNFGQPGNVQSTPETFQKTSHDRWEAVGGGLKAEYSLYSDMALSDGVADAGAIYVVVYRAPDTVEA